jgi:hypothetical protein
MTSTQQAIKDIGAFLTTEFQLVSSSSLLGKLLDLSTSTSRYPWPR